MDKPLVSICCITYNHAPFIRKCLDGFLMQNTPSCVPKDAKMSDWCEILIHDDCSTDGTTEIVKEYAAKYPDLIFPLYEVENQYSKGKAGKIDLYNYERANGKYIAYCEGDDYWTEPLKLQRQVDFLESHPDFSVTFHDYTRFYVNKNVYSDSNAHSFINKNHIVNGIEVDLNLFFKDWITMPLTMVFRAANYDLSLHSKYKYYRDSHEIYHLLKTGKGYLFTFNGGMSNRHDGGMFGGLNYRESVEIQVKVAKELYYRNKDNYTKEYYCTSLQNYLYNKPYPIRKRLSCSIELLGLNNDIRTFVKNLVR